MDIRPQKRPPTEEKPVQPPVVPPTLPTPIQPESQPQTPRLGDKAGLSVSRMSRSKIILWIMACLAALLVAASVSVAIWYHWALGPVARDDKSEVRLVVESGATSATIADTLHDHELIRSKLAFNFYTQLSGTRNKLQAGGYVLSPSQDVASIVEHMVDGKTDEFNITISPGLTLDELRDQFKKDGFSDAEITQALNASYDHPLLASRPAGATLEGYIYPETYRQNASQPLGELLERSFDQMYDTLKEKGYLDEFAKRGLSIHQAVILASIVQKEVKNPVDQKQVAQVFYKRLAEGIQLGSDVTYMYAAKQMGVTGTPSLESPYNTRKYVGLPPGPISNMNPSALDAVAAPAAGDYLYFVAGDGADEGKTFYSRTEEEHNANIAAHCHVLCR